MIPLFKGLVWFTNGRRMMERNEAGIYGQSVGKGLSISVRKLATVFQATIYAILACAYEIQMNIGPGKYVFASTARRLRKIFTAPKQRLQWHDSARGVE